MDNKVPLPAGVELSMWEKFYRNISIWFSEETREKIWNFFQWMDQFLQDFGMWIFAGALCVALLFLVLMFIRRRQRNIHKLWKLILFFLSKRQMILPLVYTFAKRDTLLNDQQLEEILIIRDQSQRVPFQKNPTQRMAIEMKVSKLLFDFFEHIESHPHHPSQAIIKKMESDFEFIDDRLVELQQIYNREAEKWNKRRRRFPIILFAFVFRIPSFQLFKPPQS
jgi:hypothetical protein